MKTGGTDSNVSFAAFKLTINLDVLIVAKFTEVLGFLATDHSRETTKKG